MSTIPDRVKAIMSPVVERRPADIGAELHLLDDLHIDSLARVEMMMDMEDQFGIYVSDDDVSKLETVGDVIALVEKLAA